MHHILNLISKVTLLGLVFICLFSCSKDVDLLSEYVIAKNDNLQSIALLSDDRFFIAPGQNSIVMDVLNNDNLIDPSQVTIVSTSTPQNGDVNINEDNTLTYIPRVVTTPEETATPNETATVPQEDTFTYTAEVIDPDTGDANKEEATVTVALTNNDSDMGGLKAFPGAEGFGKYTTGGRGGFVYHVTNLNEDGSGSLRYGMETLKGKRTIVFDVSGYINISKPLKIRPGYGNLTIAGQTAPGDGISIRGASIWVSASNVIIRYLKIRPGEDAYNPAGVASNHPDYEPDDGMKIQAISGNSIENIIIDHCTITWAHDGLLDIGSPKSDMSTFAKNITVQNCLLAENIDKQYGVLLFNTYDISFYKNIIAFTSDRNIAISSPEGKGIEMVNNLIYCTDRSTWYREGNVNDFIGNKFISGARTRQYETFKMELSHSNGDITKSSIYLKNNTDDGSNADFNNNSRAMPYIVDFPNHQTGIPIFNENEIEDILVNDAGSSLYYDSNDLRIMSSIKTRSGNLISSESEVGGYPYINSESRDTNYDIDKDGLADSWEMAKFGDLSKKPEDDANNDGYTNLDEFLFSISQ